jgi:exonuclease VII small subunit
MSREPVDRFEAERIADDAAKRVERNTPTLSDFRRFVQAIKDLQAHVAQLERRIDQLEKARP